MPNGSYNTYVQVEIGGLKIHQTEDHIISIQNKRIMSDKDGNVIVSIYDDTAFAIEAKILSGETDFSYWYGFTESPNTIEHKAMITHVGAEMTAKGMILTIEGVPQGADVTNASMIRSFSGLSIDQIVTQIAIEQGWGIKLIVPCKMVPSDENVVDSGHKTYRQEGVGVEEFIKTVLIPDAVSLDGLGNYELYLETTGTGKYVSFAPKDYDPGDTAATFTFIVGQDHNKIISFNPDYDKGLVAMIGGGGVEVSATNGVYGGNLTYDILRSKTTAKETLVTTRVAGSSFTAAEAETLARNIWGKLNSMPYKATLVVVGDPTLKPRDYIDMVVLTPSNTLHHTSGRYCVNSIEDMVDTGVFTSTLEMTKVGGSSLEDSFAQTGLTIEQSLFPGYFYENTDFYKINTSLALNYNIPETPLNAILVKTIGLPRVEGGFSRSGVDDTGLICLIFKENKFDCPGFLEHKSISDYEDYMKSNNELFVHLPSSVTPSSGDIVLFEKDGVTKIGIATGNGRVIYTSDTKVVGGSLSRVKSTYCFKKYPAGYTTELKIVQTSEKLGWPCSSVKISSEFGMRIHPEYGDYRMHYGVDVTIGEGQPIFAAEDGVVAISTSNDTAGNHVEIDHSGSLGENIYTRYLHASELLVKKGDTVVRGQIIARVGNTGVSTGAHLHYSIRENGEYKDPLSFYPGIKFIRG